MDVRLPVVDTRFSPLDTHKESTLLPRRRDDVVIEPISNQTDDLNQAQRTRCRDDSTRIEVHYGHDYGLHCDGIGAAAEETEGPPPLYPPSDEATKKHHHKPVYASHKPQSNSKENYIKMTERLPLSWRRKIYGLLGLLCGSWGGAVIYFLICRFS